MRLHALLFAAFVQLIIAAPAHAFGERGHRLIAQIAYAHLTPSARSEVDALVATDFSATPGCPISSFEDAAIWSDCVRRIPSYRNQSPWHYDNIPLCGPPLRATYCADGNCATGAIERAERKVAGTHFSQRDRQRALARLVHIIGDIHQPLHAIDMDRGGNDTAIRVVGGWAGPTHASNLHALWDSNLVDYAIADRPQAVHALANAHARDWSGGDARAWATDSHDLAVAIAYGGLSPAVTCNHHAAGRLDIGEGYAATAAPILREQLAKAGLRLASTLNRVFGATP